MAVIVPIIKGNAAGKCIEIKEDYRKVILENGRETDSSQLNGTKSAPKF